MAQNTQEIAIDLLINGLDKLDRLNAGLRDLRQAASGVERASSTLDRLGDSSAKVARNTDSVTRATQATATAQTRAADAALRQEQALARLQQAQGNTAGAVKTLQNALASFEGSQIQAIRAQIQLTNYQNNYANSVLISAVRNQQLGSSFQSLLGLLGPVGAGIGQIVGLLEQIANAGRLFGGTGPALAQTAKEAGNLASEFDAAAQASIRLSRSGAEFRAPRSGAGAAGTESGAASGLAVAAEVTAGTAAGSAIGNVIAPDAGKKTSDVSKEIITAVESLQEKTKEAFTQVEAISKQSFQLLAGELVKFVPLLKGAAETAADTAKSIPNTARSVLPVDQIEGALARFKLLSKEFAAQAVIDAETIQAVETIVKQSVASLGEDALKAGTVSELLGALIGRNKINYPGRTEAEQFFRGVRQEIESWAPATQKAKANTEEVARSIERLESLAAKSRELRKTDKSQPAGLVIDDETKASFEKFKSIFDPNLTRKTTEELSKLSPTIDEIRKKIRSLFKDETGSGDSDFLVNIFARVANAAISASERIEKAEIKAREAIKQFLSNDTGSAPVDPRELFGIKKKQSTQSAPEVADIGKQAQEATDAVSLLRLELKELFKLSDKSLVETFGKIEKAFTEATDRLSTFRLELQSVFKLSDKKLVEAIGLIEKALIETTDRLGTFRLELQSIFKLSDKGVIESFAKIESTAIQTTDRISLLRLEIQELFKFTTSNNAIVDALGKIRAASTETRLELRQLREEFEKIGNKNTKGKAKSSKDDLAPDVERAASTALASLETNTEKFDKLDNDALARFKKRAAERRQALGDLIDLAKEAAANEALNNLSETATKTTTKTASKAVQRLEREQKKLLDEAEQELEEFRRQIAIARESTPEAIAARAAQAAAERARQEAEAKVAAEEAKRLADRAARDRQITEALKQNQEKRARAAQEEGQDFSFFARLKRFFGSETGAQTISGALAAPGSQTGANIAGLRAAAQSLQSDFAGIGEFAEKAGSIIGVAFGVTAVGALAAAIAGGVAFVGLLSSIAQAGLKANSDLEKLNISLASTISGTGDIQIDGRTLDGAEKFSEALNIAKDQVRQIREEARGLGLPVQEVAEGFQATLSPLTQFGLTLDESRKTTLKIVLAMQAMDINLREIGQETRALLNGETSRQDRLNRQLRITKEELEAAKQRGEVQKLLNERLDGFAAGGQAFARSFQGSQQAVRSLFEAFSTTSTTGLFEGIRSGFNKALDQIADRGGSDKVFAGLNKTFERIFDNLGSTAKRGIDEVFNAFVDLSNFLDKNQEGVQRLINSFEMLGERILEVGKDVLDVFGFTGKEAMTFFAELIDAFTVAISVIEDAVVLLWASFAAGLQIVVSLIEGVLIVALSSLGISVTNLLKDFSRLADGIETKLKRIGEGFKNALEAEDEIAKRLAYRLLNLDNAQGGKTKPPPPKGNFKPKKITDKQKKSRNNASERDAILKAREDLLAARFALEKAFADREIALARQRETAESEALQEAFEKRSITIEEFYARKAELQRKTADAERAAIQSEIDFEKKRLASLDESEKNRLANARKELGKAKTPADREKVSLDQQKIALDVEKKRTEIQTKITQLETQLQVATEKSNAETEKGFRDREKAYLDLRNAIRDIETQLDEETGSALDGSIIKIGNQFRDLLKRAVKEFGEDSKEVAAILALQGALINKALIQRQESIRSTLQQQLQNQTQAIQNLIDAGLVNEKAGKERILELERAKRKELERQLELQIAIVKATLQEGPEKQAQLAALEQQRLQIQRLGVDPRYADIRKGLDSDIRSAFDQFLTSGKASLEDLGQFALGVVNSIRRALARVLGDFVEKKLIQPAVDFFLDKVLGIKTIDPATLANTTATSANTAALTALTAALTAKSVAGISSDAFRLALPDDLGQASEQQAAPVQSLLGKIGSSIKGFAEKIGGVVGKVGGSLGSIAGAILGFVGRIFGSIFGGANPAASPDLIAGFSEGGYTGDGATNAPAGFVHGGEFVQPAPVVRRWGAGFFEAIRTGAITPADISARVNSRIMAAVAPRNAAYGMAAGGLVSDAPAAGADVRINNVIVDDRRNALAALTSPEGVRTIMTILGRNRAAVNAQLQGA